jgi:threonine synthase
MWRYRELLPLRPGEAPVTLGEGGTPLLELPRLSERLGVRSLLKDEGGNPTGSFKDRGMSAAVTRAVHDGAPSFVLPSAGNAGVALAAYAVRSGRPATVFIPDDTPPAVAARCRAYGIDFRTVPGLISDCGRRAAAFAAETGAFDLSTLREPYRIEGKKTMGLEILEALDWRPPDAVIYPTGGGTGLIGTWKALGEAAALGWIDSPSTRMYAVQAEGCAPVVRAWTAGEERATRWEDAQTAAWGLRVPSARGDALMLRALRDSGGGAVTVSDEAMCDAAGWLGREDGTALGIEGGAVVAAALTLVRRGELAPGETVVLFNTGNLANYGWYTA